ncbi:MAG: DUF4386 domain-containing protein [Thermoplasmata archaeon]|nr:DUF4386 domain-containing protein [Thermoplasmata archaeon]
MGDEKSVLRWGGLAGMLVPIFFILTAVILLALVPQEPADPEGLVMRFPEDRAAIAVGEGLYLVAVILLVTLFLALYRALRGTSVAPALFGSGLGLVGLAVLAVGALPNIAFNPISDLYHAPGTTPEEQATLVLMWQATQGIFNETDTVGFILMAIGFIVLGVAMLGSPAFGKRFGGVSMVLGVAVVAGMSVFGVDSDSVIPFVLVAFIIFPLLFGWKLYSLSKGLQGV